MQVHAHRGRLQSRPRGDLRPGHALDQTQHKGLAVGFGQATDDLQSLRRLGLAAPGVRHLFAQFLGRARAPVEVGRAVARDHRHPGAEAPGVAQRAELAERDEENVLREVAHLVVRHARQKDAVHERRVHVVEARERLAVARAGRGHERGLRRGHNHLRLLPPPFHQEQVAGLDLEHA